MKCKKCGHLLSKHDLEQRDIDTPELFAHDEALVCSLCDCENYDTSSRGVGGTSSEEPEE